eukprot:TRINITY_DN61663_c0_g1_i1.p1 TRINITY_DN61663_c0_g1~~TRINITY_DN61663_c0_g1_i1.p1  ORF type:complete len:768 (-),score=145.82 TRINITY_DN61663_c0_g1_i1:45-2348(-)
MPKDGSSSVRAVVRVRPLLPHELDSGDESCCQVTDDQSMLVRVGSVGNQWRKYSFDACLPDDRSQKQVFQECGVTHLVDAAVNGYSATVLAYGQTGSGKTFTMMGRLSSERSESRGEEVKRDDGMIMRAARRLFKRLGDSSSSVTVSASFAEIFNAPGAVNECICDLLNPEAGNLQVRFGQGKGFFISDLAVADCRTVADVRAVLEAGVQNRRVSAHALNRESSRTHALFTLHIDAERNVQEGGDLPAANTYGKITFVDLAGSERLKESLSEGNARKETQAINKSLFTLGQVISALAQGKAERHVPYRNSKLTQLLQESFGGSALCLMITCISPASTFAEESCNSLNYAQKAMNIQNSPVIQLDEQQRVLHELRSENAMLRRELEIYRSRFGVLTPRGLALMDGTSALSQAPPAAPKSEAAGAGSEAAASTGVLEAAAVQEIPDSYLRLDSMASPASSSRGRSVPPNFSPQGSFKPPAPQSLNAPAPAINSARNAREATGSYALAAAKRQQMRQQVPTPPQRRHQRTQAGKQLPPLPSRGSTAQSGAEGRRHSAGPPEVRPSSGLSHGADVADSEVASPASLAVQRRRSSVGEHGERRHKARSPSPQNVQPPSREQEAAAEASLAREQLEHLDQADWSAWQVDFQRSHPDTQGAYMEPQGDVQGLQSARRSLGAGSESRSTSSGSSRSRSSAFGTRGGRLPQQFQQPVSDQAAGYGGGVTPQERGDITSTASGTPMEKGMLDDNTSLANLNSKLSLMHQATSALVRD